MIVCNEKVKRCRELTGEKESNTRRSPKGLLRLTVTGTFDVETRQSVLGTQAPAFPNKQPSLLKDSVLRPKTVSFAEWKGGNGEGGWEFGWELEYLCKKEVQSSLISCESTSQHPSRSLRTTAFSPVPAAKPIHRTLGPSSCDT